MLDQEQIFEVEKFLGYKFKNKVLLGQAFIHSSFTNENPDIMNNEILEYYGDKCLDQVINYLMFKRYSSFTVLQQFQSFHDEDELTEIKKKIVCSDNLSHVLDFLDWEMYMDMGVGALKDKVYEEDSVKEALVEAIIGAVAVDCDFAFKKLVKVVKNFVEPQEIFAAEDAAEKNPVNQIEDWRKKHRLMPLEYRFVSKENNEGYECELYIDEWDWSFVGLGSSKKKAREEACINALEYIRKTHNDITPRMEVGDPDYEKSVNQVQELFQKKFLTKMPTYSFEETHDEDGNPLWTCTLRYEGDELDYVSDLCSTKVEAKKQVSFEFVSAYIETGDENPNYE